MSDQDVRLFVTVDLKKCCGYTTCADVCPEVYKLDDDGFAYTENGRVPLGLEEKARAGANACPEGAISLLATDPGPARLPEALSLTRALGPLGPSEVLGLSG